ncbi:MAG: 3'(2'),5'-bisphosphate nucleotidase CysQ [Alphaproteobacteria bacterium]
MSILSELQIQDLIKAVAKASAAIMEIYNSEDFGVEIKSDSSPLTLADKASHAILVSELASICPDIPVVSEEDAEHIGIGEQPTFWLVDPIDGTKEFIKRNGEFTVNIGLVHNKSPIFGVVSAPNLERVWVGNVIAKQAYLINATGQKTPIRTRVAPLDGLTVVGSKSHATQSEEDYLSNLKIAGKTAVGSSLKFCIIAEGAADLYPRAGRTMEWDTAAGHAVLVAAGGRVSNWDETPFTYTKPDFANDHGFIAHAH